MQNTNKSYCSEEFRTMTIEKILVKCKWARKHLKKAMLPNPNHTKEILKSMEENPTEEYLTENRRGTLNMACDKIKKNQIKLYKDLLLFRDDLIEAGRKSVNEREFQLWLADKYYNKSAKYVKTLQDKEWIRETFDYAIHFNYFERSDKKVNYYRVLSEDKDNG